MAKWKRTVTPAFSVLFSVSCEDLGKLLNYLRNQVKLDLGQGSLCMLTGELAVCFLSVLFPWNTQWYNMTATLRLEER